MIQVSAQVSWQAQDAQEAIDTVNAWVVHEGAQVTLVVEQPERAITQMVMGLVSTQPSVADGDGSVTITLDPPDELPPAEDPGPPPEEAETDTEATTTEHTATVFLDQAGEWRWHVQAGNHEVISVGESYGRHGDAVRGLVGAHPEFADADFSDGKAATVDVPAAR